MARTGDVDQFEDLGFHPQYQEKEAGGGEKEEERRGKDEGAGEEGNDEQSTGPVSPGCPNCLC